MPKQTLASAVQRALRDAPCSTRELARAAGIAHSTLGRIAAGKRNVTPAVAEALSSALRSWGKQCERLAAAIETALKGD